MSIHPRKLAESFRDPSQWAQTLSQAAVFWIQIRTLKLLFDINHMGGVESNQIDISFLAVGTYQSRCLEQPWRVLEGRVYVGFMSLLVDFVCGGFLCGFRVGVLMLVN
ncbi:hypothetical protein M758_9G055700 [Ceratodon purpureus]|nr:hypothetical protein M758_9G055700 [Ceratodon purpureus]